MRCRHRFARVGLALFLIPVFLSTALLYGVTPADAAPAKSSPPTQQPAPSQPATISGTDPLGVPEDPLGRQSEEQAAEISISVDVRDGHLIVASYRCNAGLVYQRFCLKQPRLHLRYPPPPSRFKIFLPNGKPELCDPWNRLGKLVSREVIFWKGLVWLYA